jgi:hypothetical protein
LNKPLLISQPLISIMTQILSKIQQSNFNTKLVQVLATTFIILAIALVGSTYSKVGMVAYAQGANFVVYNDRYFSIDMPSDWSVRKMQDGSTLFTDPSGSTAFARIYTGSVKSSSSLGNILKDYISFKQQFVPMNIKEINWIRTDTGDPAVGMEYTLTNRNNGEVTRAYSTVVTNGMVIYEVEFGSTVSTEQYYVPIFLHMKSSLQYSKSGSSGSGMSLSELNAWINNMRYCTGMATLGYTCK